MTKTETKKHKVELRDFQANARMLPLSAIAIVIGVAASYVALGLLKLIGLCTNLFFYGRWGTALVSPAGHHLGYWAVLVPVAGGIVVGLMARFGSDKIRGHGIPEAIEAILLKGARVQPKVAVLKPVSAAIAIGSGGPFGAEGPIIMTGGALGSLIAQFFHLSDAERKTLLVAGAAAGMSATFATPFAAVLLAVELLLFEWKPRSLIPVALASATAGAARRYIIGMGPLFPTAPHPAFIGPKGLLGCLAIGVLAGVLAAVLSFAVYFFEDSFDHIKLHWMWWPAIGGLAIGLGGLIYPPALGVGYDLIGKLLQGDYTLHMIVGILLVKSFIWSFSLGSGTSGGILAPVLMIGGALGALLDPHMPHVSAGFWPLISMAAVFAGAIGSPLTGAVFAFELVNDPNVILPLLIATISAHAFTSLVMPRSILTEKLSRRGYHLSREYSVDPLECLMVKDVMRTNVVVLPVEARVGELQQLLQHGEDRPRGQHLYPVMDGESLTGVVTRNCIQSAVSESTGSGGKTLAEVMVKKVEVAYGDEQLRIVAQRMAVTGYTRMPVVDSDGDRKVIGMVSLPDMLKARLQNFESEERREGTMRLRMPLSFSGTKKAVER